jgi:hypothetical protein
MLSFSPIYDDISIDIMALRFIRLSEVEQWA